MTTHCTEGSMTVIGGDDRRHLGGVATVPLHEFGGMRWQSCIGGTMPGLLGRGQGMIKGVSIPGEAEAEAGAA